jgi:hypothetical protein
VHSLVTLVVGGFGCVVFVVVELILVVDLDIAAAQIALQAKLSEVSREADVLGEVGVGATKHVCVSLRLWRIMVV